jgi:hypothetical protein
MMLSQTFIWHLIPELNLQDVSGTKGTHGFSCMEQSKVCNQVGSSAREEAGMEERKDKGGKKVG